MNKIITLSLALVTTLCISADAKRNASNPFKYQPGTTKNRQVTTTNTSGKTNALVSRLISTGTNFYDGSSYRLADSSKYWYSPQRGFYNDLWEDWDYDTVNHMRFVINSFKLINRSYNEYNSSNMPTLMVSEAWDGSNWLTEDRSTITYGANGNVASYEYESNSGSGLEKEFKIVVTYNASNKVETSTEQEWDAGSSQYIDAYRTVYIYNTNDDVSEEHDEIFNGTSWDPSSRTTYTYDASFNQTAWLSENYNAGNWEPSYRTTQMFDPNNDMIQSTNESYTAGNWQITNESYYTYDSRHNAVTSEYHGYNGTAVVPYSFNTMSYNTDNQILTSESKSWNTNTSQFELQAGDADMRWHYEEFPVTVKYVSKQPNAALTVFPVPAANFININLALDNPQGIFVVMQDATGKVVKAWNEPASKQYSKRLDTETLTPGNYIIKVMAGGQQYTQQVNITH